jgi:phosphatidylserine decarboxylase
MAMYPNKKETFIIAKEGWNTSLVMFIVFVVAYTLSLASFFFFVVLFATLLLYRNPERISLENDPYALMAPCDGCVRSIAKVTANDGKEWLRVLIEKRLYDVGVIRSPINMHVMELKIRSGLSLDASSPLADALREKKVLTCKGALGEMKIALYKGRFAYKIALNDTSLPFRTTQRLGFLSQGDVALFLPLDARISVVLNDEVKAGESVLGYFAYKANAHE